MIYKRGDYGISIEQVDGFGKMPALWVHYKNTMGKVASFSNFEAAKKFERFLEWLVMINAKEPDIDDAEGQENDG